MPALQERKALLVNDNFLLSAVGKRPFANSRFQDLVAQVHGANQEIRAPVVAFIAFRVAQLLADPQWNVAHHRADADDNASGYCYFLDLAVANHGKLIMATHPAGGDGGEERKTWLRISHDAAVRACVFMCVHR